MTSKPPTRDEIAKAPGVPLCEICGSRHPPIVPGSVPLMVPADDTAEAQRRIQAHALHEIAASRGQLTMTELQRRLGIIDPSTISHSPEITSRERIAEIWLEETVKIIEDTAREDKRPDPLLPEHHAAMKKMVHDMVYGSDGMTMLHPLVAQLTKKHELVSLLFFHRNIIPMIRSTIAEYRPS